MILLYLNWTEEYLILIRVRLFFKNWNEITENSLFLSQMLYFAVFLWKISIFLKDFTYIMPFFE